MTSSKFHFLSLFILTSSYSIVQSHEEGYVRVQISNKGLDFLKDLLIKKAETSLVPLELPNIEKSVKIPLLGKVQMALFNITIDTIYGVSSSVRTGDDGIVLDVSDATANLRMEWKYSYKNWLITVSDKGSATVQVGLEVDVDLSLKTIQGSLALSLLDCECYVNNISIKLNGGASWLYQGLADAFEGKISSVVGKAVTKKIEGTLPKLDSLLHSLPKEVSVTNIAKLNVTFVDDPELSESSVELGINGLLSFKEAFSVPHYYQRPLQAFFFNQGDKMVQILLHEDVLKSASSVYFEARKLHWTVHKLPDPSLLNTSWWRSIVPELYNMYPDHDMNLNLSVSSQLILEVEKQQIKVIIPLDIVIDILDEEELMPVACISMVFSTSVSAGISRNVLAGSLKLHDFTMSVKWSKIGDLDINQIQIATFSMLNTTILPYVNSKLKNGRLLPVFHGYNLQDAEIFCTDSWIVISSDVGPVKQFSFV